MLLAVHDSTRDWTMQYGRLDMGSTLYPLPVVIDNNGVASIDSAPYSQGSVVRYRAHASEWTLQFFAPGTTDRLGTGRQGLEIEYRNPFYGVDRKGRPAYQKGVAEFRAPDPEKPGSMLWRYCIFLDHRTGDPDSLYHDNYGEELPIEEPRIKTIEAEALGQIMSGLGNAALERQLELGAGKPIHKYDW